MNLGVHMDSVWYVRRMEYDSGLPALGEFLQVCSILVVGQFAHSLVYS